MPFTHNCHLIVDSMYKLGVDFLLHTKTHASAGQGVGPTRDDVSTTRTPAVLAYA